MYVAGPPLVAGIHRMRSIPLRTSSGVAIGAFPMPWMPHPAEARLEAFDHGVVVGVGAVLAELVDAVPALESLGPLVGVRIEHERGAHHPRRVPAELLEGRRKVER